MPTSFTIRLQLVVFGEILSVNVPVKHYAVRSLRGMHVRNAATENTQSTRVKLRFSSVATVW